jgi:all-trans-8'-apo-beta-carotenal 15,15'-oxygenase
LWLAGAAGGFQIAGYFELTAAFAQSPVFNNLSQIRLPQRLTEHPLKIEGHLPTELRGTYYKTEPALWADFNNTYKHMFDDDGFVQRFHFGGCSVSHSRRFIETRKYQTETALAEDDLPTFATWLPNAAAAKNPDDVNVAKTDVIIHANKVMALWEGGSAWGLDPKTLAVQVRCLGKSA